MSEERKLKRIRERLELKLPVKIQCRESPDFEWVEMTRLLNVTPFGCGFTLKRPTEKGRLLHLTIPMPRQLRVFDHIEPQYNIWGLVRYVKGTNLPDNKGVTFDVGVAFIGKRPPKSYDIDPSKRYEISGGFQDLASPEEIVRPYDPTDQRNHTRHNIAVDMQVELIDEKGQPSMTESTVTENISKGGATVFTTLEAPIGRFVRITSQQYNLTVHAVVRARSTGPDGIPRLHVEFIDKEWPL